MAETDWRTENGVYGGVETAAGFNVVTTNTTSPATYTSAASVLANQ